MRRSHPIRSRPGRLALAPLALLAPLVLVACGADAPSDARREPQPRAVASCVPGELTRPDGTCQPAGLPPDMPCPPGERALRTSADGRCQAAGVPPEACAAGKFVPDGRGGCAPILPEAVCRSGQMAVPGETACREVAPCGQGPWGELPVDGSTEYVDQAYPGDDSDGSPDKPWKTVQAGVDAASPGAIVAIAEGRYAEDVLVENKPVRLWGRCPARTEVAGLGSADGAIVFKGEGASGAAARGLAITGPSAGVVVRGARSLTLEELWVHGAGYVGVYLRNGAQATVRGALVERTTSIGVLVVGSEATVEATAVRAVQMNSAGKFGRGIEILADPGTGARGSLSVAASLLEQNHDVGISITGAEASVEATVIRTTRLNGAGARGEGILVKGDEHSGAQGELSLAASLLDQNHECGILLLGAEASIEGTVVRGTQPDRAGNLGRGIDVEQDLVTGARGRLSLATSLIEQNRDLGLFVGGSEAAVETTVVRGTQPNGAGKFGRGIDVERHPATAEEGRLSLISSLVEQNHDTGVAIFGSGATIEATVVRTTEQSDTRKSGWGIEVMPDTITGEGGRLSVTSSLVDQNREFGVVVGASDAAITASVVRGTLPNGAGEAGRGIEATADPTTGQGGKLSLTALLVEENHDVGLLVGGLEATIKATVVRATKAAPAGVSVGDGIVVLDARGESDVAMDTTAVTDNARAGVLYVGSAGALSLVRSSGNRFGLVVQGGTTGARPTLGAGNAFEGNAERDRIEDGEMPVPDTLSPLP